VVILWIVVGVIAACGVFYLGMRYGKYVSAAEQALIADAKGIRRRL
jgi:hypothetical protein